MKIKHFIVTRLFRYSPDITMLIGLQAILFAIGLILSDTSSISVGVLLPAWGWILLFSSYGLFKLLATIKCPPAILDCLVSGIGIWAWNYMFISSLPILGVPAGVCLILLVICEVWALTSRIFNNGCKV